MVVLALVGGFLLTRDDEAGGGEIFLQPVTEPGPDPFSPSVAQPRPTASPSLPQGTGGPFASPSQTPTDSPTGLPTPSTTPSPDATLTAGSTSGPISVTAKSGATPGLYGGTRDQQSCNKQQMIAFLDANPDKKAAWAAAQGISPAEVSGYIAGLVDGEVTGNIRVTNHGFKGGRANPFQAILQHGTAVLIDNRGLPRARCACGNPLTPPKAVSTKPRYRGTPWGGLSPTNITVINQSTTVINVITLIDINTGTPFGRQPGGVDLPLPGGGSPFPTSPATSGPTTGTGGFRLVAVKDNSDSYRANWRVNANAGTAHIEGPGYTGDYTWTVPQTLDALGTTLRYGGTSTGNYAISIKPYNKSGITLNPSSEDELHAYAPNSVSKEAVVTVTGDATEVVLAYSMGFAINVEYTYRR